MENNPEIKALIRLLDDPDTNVFSHIKNKIISYGTSIIPNLENAWGTSFDVSLQQRIEDIIHEIQFTNTKNELINWKLNNSDNLLKGAILVAKYQYPDLDENVINSKIEDIKDKIKLNFNTSLTPFEVIKIFNYVIFEVYKFRGNIKNYHAPQNFYINEVLETKKGIPITLSILYSVIAHKFSVPIYGINLPHNFILAYLNKYYDNLDHLPFPKPKVLFYINPFNNGVVLSINDIEIFIKQLKLKSDSSYFFPCNYIEVIQRLLRNLNFSYDKLGDKEKANEIYNLLTCMEE